MSDAVPVPVEHGLAMVRLQPDRVVGDRADADRQVQVTHRLGEHIRGNVCQRDWRRDGVSQRGERHVLGYAQVDGNLGVDLIEFSDGPGGAQPGGRIVPAGHGRLAAVPGAGQEAADPAAAASDAVALVEPQHVPGVPVSSTRRPAVRRR
jgi:hypothetical protein